MASWYDQVEGLPFVLLDHVPPCVSAEHVSQVAPVEAGSLESPCTLDRVEDVFEGHPVFPGIHVAHDLCNLG